MNKFYCVRRSPDAVRRRHLVDASVSMSVHQLVIDEMRSQSFIMLTIIQRIWDEL